MSLGAVILIDTEGVVGKSRHFAFLSLWQLLKRGVYGKFQQMTQKRKQGSQVKLGGLESIGNARLP